MVKSSHNHKKSKKNSNNEDDKFIFKTSVNNPITNFNNNNIRLNLLQIIFNLLILLLIPMMFTDYGFNKVYYHGSFYERGFLDHIKYPTSYATSMLSATLVTPINQTFTSDPRLNFSCDGYSMLAGRELRRLYIDILLNGKHLYLDQEIFPEPNVIILGPAYASQRNMVINLQHFGMKHGAQKVDITINIRFDSELLVYRDVTAHTSARFYFVDQSQIPQPHEQQQLSTSPQSNSNNKRRMESMKRNRDNLAGDIRLASVMGFNMDRNINTLRWS